MISKILFLIGVTLLIIPSVYASEHGGRSLRHFNIERDVSEFHKNRERVKNRYLTTYPIWISI